MMNAEIWLWLAIIATSIAIVAIHRAQVELRKALRETEKAFLEMDKLSSARASARVLDAASRS